MSANDYLSVTDHFMVGTNSFVKGQNMAIEVDGEPLLRVERRNTGDGQLLLSAEVYGSNGERLGRVVRNTWVAGSGSDSKYDVFASDGHLTMTNEDTNAATFHAQIVNRDMVMIDEADLYGANGARFHVTPDGVVVYAKGSTTPMVTLAGNTVAGSSSPVRYTSGSFSIG